MLRSRFSYKDCVDWPFVWIVLLLHPRGEPVLHRLLLAPARHSFVRQHRPAPREKITSVPKTRQPQLNEPEGFFDEVVALTTGPRETPLTHHTPRDSPD